MAVGAAAAEVVVAAEGAHGHGVGEEEVPHAVAWRLACDADSTFPVTGSW